MSFFKALHAKHSLVRAMSFLESFANPPCVFHQNRRRIPPLPPPPPSTPTEFSLIVPLPPPPSPRGVYFDLVPESIEFIAQYAAPAKEKEPGEWSPSRSQRKTMKKKKKRLQAKGVNVDESFQPRGFEPRADNMSVQDGMDCPPQTEPLTYPDPRRKAVRYTYAYDGHGGPLWGVIW